MAEQETNIPEQEQPARDEKAKNTWQIVKESWYDKIPLNLKQLDLIIALCWIAIAATVVLIYLDAADIFHLFG